MGRDVEIPWQELDSETLDRMLSELVTRDGTDYGARERTTEEKVENARKALAAGRALLYWNEELESASLVSADQVRETSEAERRDAERAGLAAPERKRENNGKNKNEKPDPTDSADDVAADDASGTLDTTAADT